MASPIIDGLRKQYPGYEDIPDSEFVDSIKEAYYPDMPKSEYLSSLQSAYSGQETPTEKPSIGGIAKQIGKDIVTDMTGLGSATGELAAMPALEKGLQIPDMSMQDLLKRGYKPEVAKNVLAQRTATQQGMAGELGQLGSQGQEQAARGTAGLVSMIPGAGAEMAATKMLGEQAVKTGLGWIGKHAAGGAAGVGSYEATRAAMEGKPASEIFDSFLQGARMGAVGGPAISKVASVLGEVPRYIYKVMTIPAARARQQLENSVVNFGNKFTSGWMRTRFADMEDPNIDPHTLAMSIMVRVLGKDAAAIAPQGTLDQVAGKIMESRDLGLIDPSFRPLATSAATPPPIEPTAIPQGVPTMEPGQALIPQKPQQDLSQLSPEFQTGPAIENPATQRQLEAPAPPSPPVEGPVVGNTQEIGQSPLPLGLEGVEPNVAHQPTKSVLGSLLGNPGSSLEHQGRAPQELLQGPGTAEAPRVPRDAQDREIKPLMMKNRPEVPLQEHQPRLGTGKVEAPPKEEPVKSISLKHAKSIIDQLKQMESNPLVQGAREAVARSGKPEEKAAFEKAAKAKALPGEGLAKTEGKTAKKGLPTNPSDPVDKTLLSVSGNVKRDSSGEPDLEDLRSNIMLISEENKLTKNQIEEVWLRLGYPKGTR